MEINEHHLLLFVMAVVPVDENSMGMHQMTKRFFNRDKSHTQHDIEAEYRLEKAKAIIERWKKV